MPMTRDQYLRRAKAYAQGAASAAAKRPRNTNPHAPDGTSEALELWVQWDEGWRDQADY